MRKTVSIFFVVLLVLGLSVFAFNVQPAKAVSGEIIINFNGSINSPVTANITTADKVTYTFNGSNYLPIVVNRSNIIINGNGYTLQGNGSYLTIGFSLSSVSNVTIKNTTITDFGWGIYLEFSSDNNTLSGNNVTANHSGGIYLGSSSDNILSSNNVTANSYGGITLSSSSSNVLSGNNVTANGYTGIELDYSSGNVLSGNNVTANGYGIWLWYSSGNVLSGNVMANDQWNFGVYGGVLSDFVNHVDTSNLVDGKPVYYLMNRSNIEINPQTYPEGVGYLGLVNCENVTVQSLTLTKNFQGLLLANTTDSKITHNNFTANGGDGVDLYYCSGTIFSRDNVSANSEYGILFISSCDNNTFSGNNVTANSSIGFWLSSSCDNNTLSGNNVTMNGYGGIDLGYYSDNNVLSGNNIANSDNGIELYSDSDSNTLSSNNVTANGIGIWLWYSSGNVLSGNVMVSNTYNFGVQGRVLSDFVDRVDASNLLDGKPMVYLMNESNVVISPQTYPRGIGYLGLVNCENVTVQGLTLTRNYQGLLLANTTDSKITDDNVTANSWDGVDLYYSFCNILSGSNVTGNGNNGVYLYSSNGSIISANTITNNYYGIGIQASSSNSIYHNNFVDNTQQVSSDGSPNVWDDGYPSGGNYWSDYRTAYPGAVENDSSAIWNTTYVIDSNNTDNYPLMGPFRTFGVGTWNGVAYSVDTVSNSTITDVNFNATAKTLSFNVTDTSGTVDFCRVTIPLSLMSGEWTVVIGNGTLLSTPFTLIANDPQPILSIATYGNYTYIYFTYSPGTETVQITSTSAVPEFQPFMLLPLFMIITLLGAIILKRKRSGCPSP